jgi:aspartyl-tRNA(Asn)/glutamyl-tRNA(Gln) amidotransferase subunit A
MGSKLYANDPPADFDDVHIQRLKAAGAIVVGKTNTPEFGLVPFTDNEVFGVTRNPWNLERTPGGSSGGAGAAIASGMVAIATASDGAGSIRIPASFTGAFGLKTSFGRVPIGPTEFHGWMDTTAYGPLTRTVRDAALYLDQVAGHHPADPRSLPRPGDSYLRLLDQPLPRLRIVFNRTLGATAVQSDVAREAEQAAMVFRDLGHDLIESDAVIPSMGGLWVQMSRFQGLAALWEVYLGRREELGERFAEGLDAALTIGPEDFGHYARARADLTNWLWRLFEDYDLLITPTMPLEAFAAAGPIPELIEGQPCDMIAFTAPFNFGGQPAATVRAGFSDGGLPVGLQIVGPLHRDDLVLQASHAYERARPWSDRWPAV